MGGIKIMKLIIDIPEVYYEALSKCEEIISSQRSGKTLMSAIYSAVGNGTPLDDVKAEIEKIPTDYCGGYIGLGKKEVIDILDNIDKELFRLLTT